ncbi:hypothetical protein [Rhodanobacter sp. L36]|uniref:hypothetical protein n=1 Tax=Rhodanobacter sp. L36 TaxID=1747221 RepID=UPI00131CE5C9|nr:hypothetical protein [Rhodanobacter sp. L36]
MNALERTLMFAVMAILVLTGLGCDEFHSADHLRNSAPSDPSAYFENDGLRAKTLDACHSGNDVQQAVWAKLEACRMAASADIAKRHGWKP